MNLFQRLFSSPPSSPRTWGSNADGTPYLVGMTVADLRRELVRFNDTDEICMSVSRKKDWNGGGLVGKLKAVESGVRARPDGSKPGQIWLKALVLDPSQE